ncbi:MAG: hypothetical protein K9G62_01100 [Alphaproteobacteria bacterium]|nr:hypothetical protein [Alphaproteobacteria bacterium]
MTTFLPRDSNNTPIPVLRFRSGGAHSLSASGSSTRNATAFDAGTRVIGVYADVPVYINFGGLSVTATATDHYFPAGLYYDVAIGGEETAHHTHIAVLAAEGSGAVYVSEKV